MLQARSQRYARPRGEAIPMSLLVNGEKHLFVATPSRYELIIAVRNSKGEHVGYAGYGELVQSKQAAQRLNPTHNYHWDQILPEGWHLKPMALSYGSTRTY